MIAVVKGLDSCNVDWGVAFTHDSERWKRPCRTTVNGSVITGMCSRAISPDGVIASVVKERLMVWVRVWGVSCKYEQGLLAIVQLHLRQQACKEA